jgi:hypothetical protein
VEFSRAERRRGGGDERVRTVNELETPVNSGRSAFVVGPACQRLYCSYRDPIPSTFADSWSYSTE